MGPVHDPNSRVAQRRFWLSLIFERANPAQDFGVCLSWKPFNDLQCLFGNVGEMVRDEVICLCQDMSSMVKEVGLGNISAKDSEECPIPHSRTGDNLH